MGSLSVIGQEKHREAYSALLGEPSVVPFGDLLAAQNAIDDNTAAFVVEPIQGEGGVHVAPTGYLRGVADAFNLSGEDPRVLARYDTTGVFPMKDLNRYHDMSRTTNLLGHQMLLARRLCENGCGFVTVSDCGWDMHANNNSPKNMTGIWPMGHQVDRAVSAFIEDIHARGLEDKILLVVTGEMGRTPRINKNGGRDHYGNLTSRLVSGGGLKMGQVIGQSDSQASEPATNPYNPSHLMGTIFHTLFDLGQLRLQTGLPGELVQIVEQARPIESLV